MQKVLDSGGRGVYWKLLFNIGTLLHQPYFYCIYNGLSTKKQLNFGDYRHVFERILLSENVSESL